jgi:hypothetical protein
MDVSKLTIGSITSLFSSTPLVAQLTLKETRQLYRQTGKCIRCGSQEHYIKDCKLAPIKTSKALISAVNNNDSGTYSDSGAYDSNNSKNIGAELDLD